MAVDRKACMWEKLYAISAWVLFACCLAAGAGAGCWLACQGGVTLGGVAAGLLALGAGALAGVRVLSGAMLRLEAWRAQGPGRQE